MPTNLNSADCFSRMTEEEFLKYKGTVDARKFDVQIFSCVDEIYNIGQAIEQGVYIGAHWLKNC